MNAGRRGKVGRVMAMGGGTLTMYQAKALLQGAWRESYGLDIVYNVIM